MHTRSLSKGAKSSTTKHKSPLKSHKRSIQSKKSSKITQTTQNASKSNKMTQMTQMTLKRSFQSSTPSHSFCPSTPQLSSSASSATPIDRDSLDPNIAYSMQGHNSEQGIKRWYRNIDIAQEPDGQWSVLLNNRYARTNRNNRFVVPSKAYAMACAMEYENQTTFMIPHTMPCTEMAKIAIDRTLAERMELTDNIMAIFNCDSATMRGDDEEHPALARAQAKVFNPMIKFIEDELKVKIETCSSFWGSEQPDETNDKVLEHINALNPFEFIVLDNITALGKSTIVGLNFLHENINIEQALRGSLMEEYYQMKVSGTQAGDTYGTWLLEAGARHRCASHRQAMLLLNLKMDDTSNWKM